MAFSDDLARDPKSEEEFWSIIEETLVQVEGALTAYPAEAREEALAGTLRYHFACTRPRSVREASAPPVLRSQDLSLRVDELQQQATDFLGLLLLSPMSRAFDEMRAAPYYTRRRQHGRGKRRARVHRILNCRSCRLRSVSGKPLNFSGDL
jgi:hypothetical protein